MTAQMWLNALFGLANSCLNGYKFIGSSGVWIVSIAAASHVGKRERKNLDDNTHITLYNSNTSSANGMFWVFPFIIFFFFYSVDTLL